MTLPIVAAQLRKPWTQIISGIAAEALRLEVDLHPKPGLVTPLSNGSHSDMTCRHFYAAIDALVPYFTAVAQAGAEHAEFEPLQILGRTAERNMLAATGGINTHRGAVFCLGLLAAAAGRAHSQGQSMRDESLGRIVAMRWGRAIGQAGLIRTGSNGERAGRRYGARGARDEAALGFPTLFTAALPVLAESMRRFKGDADCREKALAQTLFSVMAVLDDTNLLHRGGLPGLLLVQDCAREFLDQGGVDDPHWRMRAHRIDHVFVSKNLSPGGAADMIGAAWFVHRIQEHFG
jgi:triphosphoribosyl-dephospho-CoA synthase